MTTNYIDRPVAPPGESIEAPASGGGKRKYVRSEIRFPYTDIGDAVAVASAVHQNHGSSCTVDQLAADFDQTTSSGAFRNKIASAQTFGAVTVRKQTVTLTDLGYQLADEVSRPHALVDAFLNVPLYARLYEQYQGKMLPADAGLESDIRAAGVVPNQVERARQVLQRSAQKAGFFSRGRDRLVAPPGTTLRPTPSSSSGESSNQGHRETKLSDDPLLKGLWSKLPESGSFPARERKRWLRTLAVNLDMVYGEADDENAPVAEANSKVPPEPTE